MTVTVEPSVTTGPIAGSSKAYCEVEGGARVPFRRVNLSTGDHFDLYDTSGPYTDPDAVIDLKSGLPPRPGVVRDRGTQLQRARARSRRVPARERRPHAARRTASRA